MDFKHGGDVYSAAEAWGITTDQVVDFSANINPFGLQGDILETLSKNKEIMSHYPDPAYRSLKKALSAYYHLDKDQFIVGNGGIELIYRAIQALKPDRVGILAPTFIEYERAALSMGSKVEVLDTVPYGFKVPKEVLIPFARSVNVLFICNPNNPTAVLYEREFLHEVIQACPQTTFIIDEAFIEFVAEQKNYSLLYDLKMLKNVGIIRSLTKLFSIPGLRLGFMVTGNQALFEGMSWALNPWNVNGFVAAYMTEILNRYQEKPFNGSVFKPLRDPMINALSLMPHVQVLPSEVNYIFIRYTGPADLQDQLDQHHILIRDCSNYRGLRFGDYRIAVRTQAENDLVIGHLKTIIEE